jgi:hypothetical protein
MEHQKGRRARALVPLTLALAATGCVGAWEDHGGPARSERTGEVCRPGEARPDAAPLRRLHADEYDNTLRDLFPGVDLPDYPFPQPAVVEGYTTSAYSQPSVDLLVENEINAASSISDAAVQNLAAWAPCTDESAACLQSITDVFLARAYRRPPSAEERDRARAMASAQMTEHGFAPGLSALLQGVLLSPQFLFRIETGTGARDGDLVPLTGYERASRLSYFLWRTMPDDELLRAAGDGRLDDAAGIDEQARRMLDDERARETLVDFFSQWLRLDTIEALDLQPARFPEYNGEVRRSLRVSVERFVEWALFDQRSLDALLTSDVIFVDRVLGELFGLARPSGVADGEFVPVSAPHRRGLLTQPGILASTSHGRSHSPVLRGVRIMDRFLCQTPPPPPPEVNVALEEPDGITVITTRQQFEEKTRPQACASCHAAINGIGFAFEHYDALGRYVTEDSGEPVDSSGRLTVGGGEQPVADAIELATILESHPQVHQCITEHMHRYVFGRTVEGRGDECEVARLADSWASSGGDPSELIVAIVTSQSFLMRPIGE